MCPSLSEFIPIVDAHMLLGYFSKGKQLCFYNLRTDTL